ncbi:MAG: hypothetical protein ACRDCN_10940, partial [Tannerellaceae bacterium]
TRSLFEVSQHQQLFLFPYYFSSDNHNLKDKYKKNDRSTNEISKPVIDLSLIPNYNSGIV